ncbi:hypothetical protein BH24ACT15_BH24ACT15_18220 [soil metagenome]
MILRQAVRLLAPMVRAVNWVPVAPAGALALLAVWLISRDDFAGLEERIAAVRTAALLLVLSTAFVLDDATAELSDSTPAPLLLPRTVRVLLMFVPTSSLWAAVLWVMVRAPLTEPSSLPIAALTLELGAIVMLTIAIAAVTIKLGNVDVGGRPAAAALLGLTLVSWLMPEDTRLWVYPGQTNWVEAHVWWCVILITAGTVFGWASVDQPADRTHRRGMRRRPLRSLMGG